MSFASPYYLLGLLGVIIPIAIHLWSRDQLKKVRVGSIKLIEESETVKASSIKITQLPLLLLRIALVVILVLLLSDAFYESNRLDTKKTMALVDKLYLDSDSYSRLSGQLEQYDEVRLLALGFPLIEDDNTNEDANYWRLLSDLGSLSADSIVIYSPLRLASFTGERSQLPTYASVVSLPMGEETTSEKRLNTAHWQAADSVIVNEWVATDQNVRNQSKVVAVSSQNDFVVNVSDSTIRYASDDSFVKIKPLSTYSVSITTDERSKTDQKYFEHALSAISEFAPVRFEFLKSDETDILICLSEDCVTQSGSKLTFTQQINNESATLLNKTHATRYSITKRIDPLVAGEEYMLQLPEELWKAMEQSIIPNEEVGAQELAKIDLAQLMSPESKTISSEVSDETTEKPLQFWLLALLVLLLFTERVWSIKTSAR